MPHSIRPVAELFEAVFEKLDAAAIAASQTPIENCEGWQRLEETQAPPRYVWYQPEDTFAPLEAAIKGNPRPIYQAFEGWELWCYGLTLDQTWAMARNALAAIFNCADVPNINVTLGEWLHAREGHESQHGFKYKIVGQLKNPITDGLTPLPVVEIADVGWTTEIVVVATPEIACCTDC